MGERCVCHAAWHLREHIRRAYTADSDAGSWRTASHHSADLYAIADIPTAHTQQHNPGCRSANADLDALFAARPGYTVDWRTDLNGDLCDADEARATAA